jgi:beta-lactamase class D
MRFLLFLLITSLVALGKAEEGAINLESYFKGHEAAFVLLDLQSGKIARYNTEECAKRFSPCSTFKIPNTLIGLETGVIPDASFSLKWDGTPHPMAVWNKDQTLKSAFQDSCLWFYQVVARRIGAKEMQKHVSQFKYGNEDTSGGIDQFWLSNTLLISPNEQVSFLKRVLLDDSFIDARSKGILLNLMLYRNEPHFVLRGKTGTAGNPVKAIATEGWYVGFAESESKKYIFATHIKGGDNPSGRHARDISEKILRDLLTQHAEPFDAVSFDPAERDQNR